MLLDSKQTTEKEVFKKRLEMEKMQWLYDSKSKEYDELHQELQFEFNLKGLDIDKVTAEDLDGNFDELKKTVAEYDAMRNTLAEKIENLYGILQSRPADNVPQEEIDVKEQKLAALIKRQKELEAERKLQLDVYVSASTARMKVTAAAAEARALTNLRATLDHNDLIGLLIKEKINNTLVVASQYLNAFVGGEYIITESDGKVVVKDGAETLTYDELPLETQTALYVGLLLAVPNTDDSDGRWIVFEEHININKKLLADMLLNINNISYVIGVTKE